MGKLRYPSVVRGKNRINLDGLQRASRLTTNTPTTNDFFIRKYLHRFDVNSDSEKLFTLRKGELIEPSLILIMEQRSDHEDANQDPFFVGIGTQQFAAAFGLITLDNTRNNTVIYDIDTSGMVAQTRRLLLGIKMVEDKDVMFSIHPGKDTTQGRASLLITTLRLEV